MRLSPRSRRGRHRCGGIALLPAKKAVEALQDAASVASILITTEAMIAEKPKDKSPPMPGGGMDF